MRDLLSNPVIVLIVLGILTIYLSLIFHYASRSQKFCEIYEKFFTIFLLFSLGGVAIFGLDKFHPKAIYMQGKTLPSLVMQLGFYGISLIFISSRLRYTLRDMIYVLSVLLQRNPFFCLFLLLAGLSFTWAESTMDSLKPGIVFLCTTVFFVYIAKQYPWPKLFELLLLNNVLMMTISAFYAIVQPGIGTGEKGWQGIMPHSNPYSFLMALTAVMCYLKSAKSPKEQFKYFALIGLGIISLQEANSGMGKVVLIALIALLISLRFIKKMQPRLALAAIIFFIAVTVCLIILITQNAEYIIVEQLGKDMTLTGRTLFWPQVIERIGQSPILGYGYEGFWQPWRGADNPAAGIIVAKSGFKPEHSHNGFIDLTAELGLLGLFSFLISMVTNIAQSVLYMKQSRNVESVMPLLLLLWVVVTNITEGGLSHITLAWAFYVLITVRLSLDTVGETFRSSDRVYKHLMDYS